MFFCKQNFLMSTFEMYGFFVVEHGSRHRCGGKRLVSPDVYLEACPFTFIVSLDLIQKQKTKNKKRNTHFQNVLSKKQKPSLIKSYLP